MATAKKTTVKKTVTPKKKVVTNKVPTNKRSVASKSTANKTSSKKSAQAKSFKLSKNVPSFTTFKITEQTVYWIIIIAVIIFFQLWIISLQIEISNLLDEQLSSINATY